jgi:hypothetical protein
MHLNIETQDTQASISTTGHFPHPHVWLRAGQGRFATVTAFALGMVGSRECGGDAERSSESAFAAGAATRISSC